MSPFGSSALPLVIIAMGMIAVILSFLVPDKKKSMISLILAGVIILTGVIQLGSQSIERLRWNSRMKEIQRDRQADLEALRAKMKDKNAAASPAAPAVPDVDTKKN